MAPFSTGCYAERWDESTQKYLGLLIEKSSNAHIIIDSDSVIIKPDVAEAIRPALTTAGSGEVGTGTDDEEPTNGKESSEGTDDAAPISETEKLPTRFLGTVMISTDRPARDMHQIVEAIVEQLTTLPSCEVSLKLEIDAESTGGFDRAKVRTLLENANTLGFIDKSIK